MKKTEIIIRGAKTNNLKNISLTIPKDKLVVFTGVSGSGKSSLLFDTIYTEAQRQLVETFSTFARARMPKLSRPDANDIKNLSTAIVIDQKKMGSNSRSTVGTATEIITYLRLLYSRFGQPSIGPSFYFSFNHPEGMCPSCQGIGRKARVNLDLLLDRGKTIREGAISHPEWKVGSWNWREIVSIGLFDVDKPLEQFSPSELDMLLYTEPVPVKKEHGSTVYAKNFEGIARKMERLVTEKAEEQAPSESKNAYQKYFDNLHCEQCNGTRLNHRARSVEINDLSLDLLCDFELTEVETFLAEVDEKEAQPLVTKSRFLLQQLIEIGVGYLTLNRNVSTLSGGESQRVKTARQLDCNLVDLLYVMDEPSIGLHPRDTNRLLKLLARLRDRGNSVFVVEHDPDIIKAAEWIVDIGPRAGRDGGSVIYNGPAGSFMNTGSITEDYLRHKPKPTYKRKKAENFIHLDKITLNNLKNVSVKIPRGVLTCVTGVAGSGKSSLIYNYFVQNYPRAIIIDQSPIGRSSRANPATYIGLFDLIRKEFSAETGQSASLFSFNSSGACPKCKGQGILTLDLHFLDAAKTICDQCNGSRYQQEILDLKCRCKSIAEVLDFTVEGAQEFFSSRKISKLLEMMQDVGLGYLKLGQSLSALSGGESQRLKLASELHKEGNIYVMDEPTTGLHMSDIARLYSIIKNLTEQDNTVIVIEHNLDLIRLADWIIDMGPEGGKMGGEVIFEGVPENLVKHPGSHTGRYLKDLL